MYNETLNVKLLVDTKSAITSYMALTKFIFIFRNAKEWREFVCGGGNKVLSQPASSCV